METIYQTIYYIIERETSKYNKYMKWHLICFESKNLNVISKEYTKTKKDALALVAKPHPLPVGDRLLVTSYHELDQTGI